MLRPEELYLLVRSALRHGFAVSGFRLPSGHHCQEAVLPGRYPCRIRLRFPPASKHWHALFIELIIPMVQIWRFQAASARGRLCLDYRLFSPGFGHLGGDILGDPFHRTVPRSDGIVVPAPKKSTPWGALLGAGTTILDAGQSQTVECLTCVFHCIRRISKAGIDASWAEYTAYLPLHTSQKFGQEADDAGVHRFVAVGVVCNGIQENDCTHQ